MPPLEGKPTDGGGYLSVRSGPKLYKFPITFSLRPITPGVESTKRPPISFVPYCHVSIGVGRRPITSPRGGSVVACVDYSTWKREGVVGGKISLRRRRQQFCSVLWGRKSFSVRGVTGSGDFKFTQFTCRHVFVKACIERRVLWNRFDRATRDGWEFYFPFSM